MSLKGENRERMLFQAAIRLFREKGYSATSVRDIADLIGVQKSALYHYVGSKEDLLFRISRETLSESVQYLEQVAATAESATEKLRRALHHHIVYVAARGPATTVFLRDIQELSADHRDEVLSLSRRYMALWEEFLRLGIDGGEFRRLDVKMMAMAIFGAGNWVATWFRQPGRLTPEQIAEIFCDLFLSGLLAPPNAQETAGGSGALWFEVPIPVRWTDLGPGSRLSSAALVAYCETALDAFLAARAVSRAVLESRHGVWLATSDIDLRSRSVIQVDAPLLARVRVQSTWVQGFTVDLELLQMGSVACSARISAQTFGLRGDVAAPLPDDLRQAVTTGMHNPN